MTTADAGPLKSFWSALPEPLRVKLRLGFTGKDHLLDMAGWCIGSQRPELAPVGFDAMAAAFGEHPLDGGMARALLSNDAASSLLPEATRAPLQALADRWNAPDNTTYFRRLLGRRDMDKLLAYLENMTAKEPDNLYWRQQCLTFGLVAGRTDWTRDRLDITPPPGLEPVFANLAARVAEMNGDCRRAARLSQETGVAFGPAYADVRAGHCRLRDGDADSGRFHLLRAVAKTPWNAGLILRLHDLLIGVDAETRPLDGTVAVLLYSWNKAEELDATLASLHAADLGDAAVFVLDNGSADATPAVLDSWRARFADRLGQERFTTITLPVNVGAPAARNWLMRRDDVQSHDFICYLDDDVTLPPDWLDRLGAAVHRYPDAGVWGCKVVDHANPFLLQSADSHLLAAPDAPPMDLSRTAPNPFRLSDLHVQTLDFGCFDILRPCASVTGCCHLFRAETLLEAGDFAIQLSPSQYDDMEHDLRRLAAGKTAVHQGHLTVRHKKRTGVASHASTAEEGAALGNKYKMQTMHDPVEMTAAMELEQGILEEDLLRKMDVVEAALAEAAGE